MYMDCSGWLSAIPHPHFHTFHDLDCFTAHGATCRWTIWDVEQTMHGPTNTLRDDNVKITSKRRGNVVST